MRQRLIIAAIVVGVLVLIGVVIWTLLNVLGSHPEAGGSPAPTTSASQGPLPRDEAAKNFQAGECFADFNPNNATAKAVACNTPHSAQLVAVFNYGADDSFPGTKALGEKGREVCHGATLNAAAANYQLLQQNVYPSSSSWDRGDRRVDCFIVVDSGNTIKDDVLKK